MDIRYLNAATLGECSLESDEEFVPSRRILSPEQNLDAGTQNARAEDLDASLEMADDFPASLYNNCRRAKPISPLINMVIGHASIGVIAQWARLWSLLVVKKGIKTFEHGTRHYSWSCTDKVCPFRLLVMNTKSVGWYVSKVDASAVFLMIYV